MTLALRLGFRRSLVVSLLCVVLAFGLFLLAGVRAGWRLDTTAGLARWAAVLLSAGAWGAVLWPWLARHAALGATQHQRRMYLALGAWAVTDLVVVLAWAT